MVEDRLDILFLQDVRRLAKSALVDDTAAVRSAGVAMLPAAVRALGTGPAGRALREDVAALASSGVFRQRMTCVLLSSPPHVRLVRFILSFIYRTFNTYSFLILFISVKRGLTCDSQVRRVL